MRDLFLLHGAGQSGDVWAGYPGHHPSLPGRADSPGPARATVAGIAAWLIPRLPPEPVLVGHSLGGAVAIEVALAVPVRALILLSTGARLRVRQDLLDLVAGAAQIGTAITPGVHACLTPEGADRIGAVERAVPPATALADWQAAHTFDRLGDIGRVRAPVRVLVGDQDVMTPPRYSRFLADNIPGAQVEILPGVGHMLHAEARDAVLARLQALWQDLPRPGGGGPGDRPG